MRGARTDGAVIRRMRLAAGLTQEALATASSCDVKTVRKAEKDGNVDLNTLHRMAKALGVSTSAMVRAANDPEATHENIRHALLWLDAFNARDVDRLVSLWRKDGVRHIPGTDDTPSGGIHRGREEIRRHLEETFQYLDTEPISASQLELHGSGDFVFMRGTVEVRHIPSGRREKLYLVNEFRFESGQIAEMLTTTDTRAFRRLLLGE